MKVLQIINSLEAGGAEKLVVETTLKYIDQGIEVGVLLLNKTDTPLYNRLKKNELVKIYGLKKNIYNPLNIFKVRSFFKKYDVIQAHLFPVSYWVAFASMLSLKKKLIVFTEHNTTNRRRSSFIFKIIDRIVYKQFKRTVTISEAVDENLRKHLGVGNRTNKIIKIHNGIDLEISRQALPYTKEELGFNSTDKLIIQVASFTPQKDQKTLIKAIKTLPEEVKLILVGTGPLISEHKSYVVSKNLSDRVFFLGIRSDVPRLLKSVDVVVLSSHYEGLSLSCIEGMASGKPFVASNTPGLGNIVSGAGIVFQDSDYEELSRFILELLNNSEYRKVIIKRCVDKAKQFDIKRMVSSYIELYKDIL